MASATGRRVGGRDRRVADAPELAVQARALGDPTRHAIFRRLSEAAGPLTVSELNEHIGMHHTAVRQHLAKLVAAGLVTEDVEPRTTRGRPRLRYGVAPAAAGRWGIPGPYERIAVLLAEALRTGDPPSEVGRRAARSRPGPDSTGDPVEALAADLARQGFEPSLRQRRASAELVLGRCPFEAAALANSEAVCALHLGLTQGTADRIGGIGVQALVTMNPRRGGCRLVVVPRPPRTPTGDRDEP